MKIAAIACLFTALTLSVEPSPVRGAETNSTPRVGSLRQFDRFIFEGTNSFSAGNLWLALNSTYDFPAVSHPLAPRDVFLRAIEQQLRLGYLHCGFPDARVTAQYDGKQDRVIVRIEEGVRYRCGAVEVTGARQMPVQPIVEALTVTNAVTDIQLQPFRFLDNAPANRSEAAETNGSNLWLEGQPAHFDDFSRQYMSGKVTNALARHGFFLSRFSLNIVTNAATQTARLQVKFLDEGPRAVIRNISVTGNRTNSDKVILNYLGLKPGMVFSSELAAAINDGLYHSARFLTNSVQVGPPDKSGGVHVTIAVVENDMAPPLGTAFDRVDQVLLKTRDWLGGLDTNGMEAVLALSGYSDDGSSVECILAPHRGLLVLEHFEMGRTKLLRRALVMSPDQMSLCVPERQQKYEAHPSQAQFTSQIILEAGPPDAEGHCMHFTAAAGMKGCSGLTNAPPYALSLSLAPTAFLRIASAKDYTRRFDGDQLIISNANAVAKIDARTGRIIDWTFTSSEAPRDRTSLHFESDAFASALARVERDGAAFANVFRTNSPIGSGFAFYCSELVQLPFVKAFLQLRLPAPTCAQLPALLHRLGDADFLAPWEAYFEKDKETEDPGGKFEIPERDQPVPSGPLGAPMAMVAHLALEGGDFMFRPGSWPWTLVRDSALQYRGQPDFLQRDLEEICRSGDAGPIGCLVTARLLDNFKSPLAKAAATQGLERLSAGAFRNDCRLFLDDQYLTGQFAARLAVTLGNLDAPELEGVIAMLPAGGADFVRDCTHRIRAAPKDQPLFETLSPALDAYWEQELKQTVAAHLRKFADN